jgi:hypothetical protein
MINEEFLHFVWKFQFFDFSNLQSTTQNAIQVVNAGLYNQNSGPDFLNARIRIDDILWCGDVELHVNSSDWYAHNHQTDENYDTVILHVVYKNDVEVKSRSEVPIVCLELEGLIPEKYITEYDTLYHSISNLPCSYAIGNLSSLFWESYSERLLIERLEAKVKKIQKLFLAVNRDYQECFYQLFAYALGLRINADAMYNLAEVTPVKLLQKHRSSRTTIEAILYGQSGLLERKYTDDYPKLLQQEYKFYKAKYKLQSMFPQLWKFFRLRPNSFPSLRISYLADFVQKSEPIFDQLFNFQSLKSLRAFFELNLSDYWTSHYVFDKKVKRANTTLGKSTIDLLIINAILPFCFFYSRQQSDEEAMMRVVDAYREIKYEDNKVVRYFKDAKVEVTTAFKSQALFHLHQQYCITRKCLNCRVFNQIIK